LGDNVYLKLQKDGNGINIQLIDESLELLEAQSAAEKARNFNSNPKF
jgi:hypothetical protein